MRTPRLRSSHGLGKFPQDVGYEGIFLDFALGRSHIFFEILNRDQDFAARRSSMEGEAMLADQPADGLLAKPRLLAQRFDRHAY